MFSILANIPVALQWLSFGQKVLQAGRPAFDAVMAAAKAHGVQADTDTLNAALAEIESLENQIRAEIQTVDSAPVSPFTVVNK